VIAEGEQKKIQWPQLTAQQAADLVAFLQTAGNGR